MTAFDQSDDPMDDFSVSTGSSLRAVILDYGDVVSLPCDPAILSWMASIFGVPVDRLRQTYGRFRHDYDRGALDAQQYWRNVAEANGVNLTDAQIEQLRKADVAMWGRLNQPILRWVEQLRRARFRTALLSNMHHDMVEHLRANAEWTKGFDVLTLSSSLGMAKPDPEIFQCCLKQLGVSADQALFIDDRDANIEAALRLGISGIAAPTTEALVDMLEMSGFTPVPEL